MQKERKALRIGIDGRVMQELHPSGIPLYAVNTIREILKLDTTNKYIIFYNSFGSIKNYIPVFEGNTENKIYRIPNKVLEWSWKFVPYPKISDMLDVEVFFSPHFINAPISKKIKRVTTIHDLSFLRNKRYFSRRKNFWHWQTNPKKTCKNSDIIIADSQSTKNDIIELYKINPEKVKVIYNGSTKYFPDVSGKRERDILERFRLKSNSYILFLSTLEPRKNIEGIIDAFFLLVQKNKNQKLVIAGKKGWLFEKIFSKTRKHNLEDRVVFTGFVSNEEKSTLFRNARVFVFPSFCEGFGLPILEARNYKVPTITSAVSSMPEVAKNAAILINPHIVSDLSEGISNILKNKDLRQILIQKEKESPDFSWEKTAQETLKYLLS